MNIFKKKTSAKGDASQLARMDLLKFPSLSLIFERYVALRAFLSFSPPMEERIGVFGFVIRLGFRFLGLAGRVLHFLLLASILKVTSR